MKKKEKQNLSKLSLAELRRKLAEEIEVLAKIRTDKSLGRLKDTCAESKQRDKIAFIKTKIREKEIYG